MAKAKRLISEKLRLADLIVEIIDARIPVSSRNLDILSEIKKKPRIIVLNKCDLADSTATNDWALSLGSKGDTVFFSDCKLGRGLDGFTTAVRKLMATDNKKRMRAVVCGIPNVGKSSFINKMIKKRKAKVENKPAVTRGVGWFRTKYDIDFLDTPGVLWPKFEDPDIGRNLAIVGSIRHNVFDSEMLALCLIEILIKHYKIPFEKRFNVDFSACLDASEVLLTIGKKRGALMSGGVINKKRAADIILEEFRSAKVGRITLEKCNNG
jgi:ribosome biogenesis GTPase A